jgi:RNase H-fold protein (predicted Holliday junction resolvase)
MLDALRPLAGCRLLAVDWGARYVGLSVRVCRFRGARPYGLLERVNPHASAQLCWKLKRSRAFGSDQSLYESQARAIAATALEVRAAAIVVGMPYLSNGGWSPECSMVEKQVVAVQEVLQHDVPVLLWDESFSSQIASRSRSRRRSSRMVHADAACVILQEVLDLVRPLEVGDELMPLRDSVSE